MKKPILNQYERYHPFSEIEIVKLKFRREFEKTRLFKFLELCVTYIATKLFI